jgi:hypothetical protein
MSSPEREVHLPDGHPEHPESPFERTDINFGRVFALVIVTGCVFALMFALNWYFFRAERHVQDERKSSPFARSSAGPPSLPPPPRLEQIDRVERGTEESYNAKAAEMLRQLHTSGPAAEKGFIHIPIEQAMKDIVKQLPVRKESSDEALHPVYAGSSNSGRTLSGAPPWTNY